MADGSMSSGNDLEGSERGLGRTYLMPDEGQAAYTQLQAFLAQFEVNDHGRLPPERDLCELLGVSRGALRKALAIAEAQGKIWRHVGKGTFLGAKPTPDQSDLANVANVVRPTEVIAARLIIEPALSREAALNGTSADLAELELCVEQGSLADSWRRYENWDNRFHRSIAVASHNRVLITLFDNLNTIRRTVAWGRKRKESAAPPSDHHSFAEHRAIFDAICNRHPSKSEAAMRTHLMSVAARMQGVDVS